jgi:flagellar motor switch protein FliN/FliY
MPVRRLNGQYALKVDKLLSSSVQKLYKERIMDESGDTISDDDWSAAIAEQERAEAAAAAASAPSSAPKAEPTAALFQDFSAKSVHAETQNDIDFIMDIPVQLTVELGRTKIAIKNLLQLAQGSVVELDGLAVNRWTCSSMAV